MHSVCWSSGSRCLQEAGLYFELVLMASLFLAQLQRYENFSGRREKSCVAGRSRTEIIGVLAYKW